MKTALKLSELGISFGGLKAVWNLNLSVPEGMIFALIGPNGAGKTTVFNLLTAVYPPTTGHIELFSKNLRGLRTSLITRQGLARTFQNIRLFKEMTVLENLMVALDYADDLERPSFFSEIFRFSKSRSVEESKALRATEILQILNLSRRAHEPAASLPYGEQRRLEIARALATGARLLLLDEPAAGMNPNETQRLVETLRTIRDHFQLTILLIEHDMKLVMNLCERIAVLDYGQKIAEGTAQEVQNNPKVIEAYLGRPAAK